MGREVFFNELCVITKPKHYSVIENLNACYKYLKSNGFSVCRIDSQNLNEMIEYLFCIPGVSIPTLRNYIYGFFRGPFEGLDLPGEVESRFIEEHLNLEGRNAIGLLLASINETIALSLSTEEKWDTSFLVAYNDQSEKITIRHGSNYMNLSAHNEWIEMNKEIVLLPCGINPDRKPFHIRHDHGMDVLKSFWGRIKNCEYVSLCVNSLPFNPDERSFVRSIKPDGIVEIVLTWTDEGFGLVLQTTGRNLRETNKIAELLEEKYANN